ncbi:hypothetical protein [Rhodococcoides yunnanense]|uniref:hypothetical protein n=1 Tax=Rhodococcoides yunnanense TaxID=278209 RepID=UPI000932C0AE|nr:hypothetical protein [Rhodococcus yunnanensis]
MTATPTASERLTALENAARAGEHVEAAALAEARQQADAETTIADLTEQGQTERRIAAQRAMALTAREDAKAQVRAGIADSEERAASAQRKAGYALLALNEASEAYAADLLEYRRILSESGLDSWDNWNNPETPPASDTFDPSVYSPSSTLGVHVDGRYFEPVSFEERIKAVTIDVKDALK